MSVSSKNNIKIIKYLKRNELSLLKKEKRDLSSEKPRKHLSLKNAFYNIEPKKKFNEDLVILNYITDKSDGRFSAKTALTNTSPSDLDYNLDMVKKYDENLNTSLSFISEFDLEDDEKENNSFNSSENESCIEEIEIKKNKKILVENEEFYFELDKEWEDIREHLLNKENN